MVGVSIELSRVTCRFGDVRALDNIDLCISPGEFLVVLGASGCGKTTLLRVVAGFHRPQAGSVQIGEQMVVSPGGFIPAEDRDVAIVFQSYALWPHMSVAGNVGFALEQRGFDRASRRQAVTQALRQVGLEHYGDRRPAALSGGQRQRVALARCLARSAGTVLLDEPLANLDPALRGTMQTEFVAMRAALGSTFLYVTHDQNEALALADRIALMAGGRILQCDTPRNIYDHPASAEAARFIGNATLLPAILETSATGGRANVRVGGCACVVRAPSHHPIGPATLAVRAHELAIVPAGRTDVLAGYVTDVRYQGSHWLVRIGVGDVAPNGLDVVHQGEPPTEGERVNVRILDGWVLPDRALP
jgi:iron(III) transport system ATP-binding protein